MVDKNVLESNWKELRSKVRPHWMALTDEDVATINGHVDTLIELLREKYGYTPAQAENEVERFLQETATAASAHQG